MKKALLALVIAMTMSFAIFTASAATSDDSSSNLVENIWNSLPETLVVKQEAILSNGQTITIFYKKSGDQCAVYTADNVSNLTINDLCGLKKSTFGIVTSVEGKQIFTASISKIRRLLKRAVIKYL